MWQKFKNENVVVLGINRSEDIKNINKFINQNGITYPILNLVYTILLGS
ncbi:hypothetical protein DRQ09_05655 [candidate division KSB1 bacterium]|nr:MAG: hypothetical protein DRQ09_05655 [candidate division KSB1 bacterium]